MIETKRIYIRPIQHTDASAILAYRSLECVAQYQYWEPFTVQKSLDFAEQNSCADISTKGVWIGLAIILKSSNELIGDCALKIDGQKAEIGCNISPKHQRHGYAQDALNLLINMCFEEFKVSEVFGITDSENLSSIKMMQSLGMNKIETFENKLLCKGRLSVEHKYSINKGKIKNIMMKQEILFVLLNDFTDWEGAYIAPYLNYGCGPGIESKYVVKTVSVTKEPVMSCGGFKVLPDYSIDDIHTDYAGIVLIGGMSWFTPEAELIVPLVKDATRNNKLVAGICNASVFLGIHGFLNEVNHTSNGLEYLKEYAGAGYKGECHYIDSPAVRDGNIVTANGFSALEFCREILYTLDAYTQKMIEKSYRMNKTGVWEAPEIEETIK